MYFKCFKIKYNFFSQNFFTILILLKSLFIIRLTTSSIVITLGNITLQYILVLGYIVALYFFKNKRTINYYLLITLILLKCIIKHAYSVILVLNNLSNFLS